MTVGIEKKRGWRFGAASFAVPFCVGVAGAVHAHHGVANFDLNKDIALEGVITNVAIHQALLASDTFLEGKMTTNFLDRVGGSAVLAAAART